ncbi:MAG: hypothetical protein AMXMBFR84_22510 [Candidatus Hydrogenedentota bacterium]
MLRRIMHANPEIKMPPAEFDKPVTEQEKALLSEWIRLGGEYEQHWAFIPPLRHVPPGLENGNPVDAFVRSKLAIEGIGPSPEADRSVLLRRVYLDIVGLPPPEEKLNQYLADQDPGAYERIVDELLASPHFGERWGRHWLDAARYADSNGYSIDGPRTIWPYRDWVINAINSNMPFDQFVTEQLAGDLLEDATRENRIATGFNRNTMINQEGGVDKEEFRIEAVFDRVNTAGTVFLGLTMACARCHDHKYDPISQREYFELFAFFNSDDEVDLPLPTTQQAAIKEKIDARVAEANDTLSSYLAEADKAALPTWEESLTLKEIRTFSPQLQEALYTQPTGRTPDQVTLVRDQFKKTDPGAQAIVSEIEKIRAETPDIITTLALTNRKDIRPTHLFVQGDFTRKAEEVFSSVPDVFGDDKTNRKNRLDLAQWLVDRNNPLTARVTVNRYWQALFGKGLVETENDFGTQGSPPTHPELLDWLAVEFMEGGWDVKALVRLICTSQTYRQSSNARPDLAEKDPTNRLLARQNRLRLEAEIVRDIALASSGLMHDKVGGPSVFPPQPDGVMDLGQVKREWTPSGGPDRYRRGMYTHFWRATPHPGLMVFDAPDAQFACTRRVRSNTPLQALTLLNDEAHFECARALARQTFFWEGASDTDRIRRMTRICLGREPNAVETELMLTLLERQRNRYSNAPDQARAVFATDAAIAAEGAAWTMVARTILNLDEFITRE